MKQLLLSVFTISMFISANAQTTKTTEKPPVKIDLSNRASDHFMIQYGKDSWGSTPDSIRTKSSSRHFNFYFMFFYYIFIKCAKHFNINIRCIFSLHN